jgi:hypothetical protein
MKPTLVSINISEMKEQILQEGSGNDDPELL